MADTKHVHGAAPVEGDGVSYSGIVWFVVILTATTVVCQLIVWGGFVFMEWRVNRGDAARAPLAAERPRPAIKDGRVITNTARVAAAGAARHRADCASGASVERRRRACPRTAGSIADAGIVRLPIDRAKTLLLERGLPTRPGAQPATPVPAAPAAPAGARAWSGRTLRIT